MGKRIKDLTTYNRKLGAQDAYFVIDNGTIVDKVEYKTMASELLSEYDGLSLGGSNRSVKTAIDSIKTILDDIAERLGIVETALANAAENQEGEGTESQGNEGGENQGDENPGNEGTENPGDGEPDNESGGE